MWSVLGVTDVLNVWRVLLDVRLGSMGVFFIA